MSVERGSRLSWKQQYQQHAQDHDGTSTSAGLTFGGGASGVGGASAGSMSDMHFLVQERAKIAGNSAGVSVKSRYVNAISTFPKSLNYWQKVWLASWGLIFTSIRGT
jgi:hypothetical protein